jgi:sialate O-acetylesterase
MSRTHLAAILLSPTLLACAELSLPAVFTDHAVLQCDRSLPVWGKADSATTVTVSFDGATATAVAGADGRWRATLPAHLAGGPYEMRVTTAAGASRTIADLLVGEVWICSGQSNMQWNVKSSNDAESEIAGADKPRIRLLQVPRVVKSEPVDDIQAAWQPCSAQTVGGFSAVGYFFGREVQEKLDVPVGLIDSSWGGTPAEAWTQLEWLEADSELRPIAQRWAEAAKAVNKEDYAKKMAEYQARAEFDDPGIAEIAAGWMAPGLDVATDWQQVALPAMWEDGIKPTERINGGVWVRRTVDIPAAWVGHDLELGLGAIDDFDITWFDGIEVGRTGKDTANWWTTPRRYTVPAKLVKAGPAVIAVRVWDRYLGGGFGGSAAQMRLQLVGDETTAISLAGPWMKCIEVSRPEPTDAPPANPAALQNAPAHLWHSMMLPLVPYAVRGAIWYQGESNAGRAEQYRVLLPAMIDSWRSAWGQGDLPFYIVSLANYQARSEVPRASDWAELREAQELTARMLRNSGQAMTIDIGSATTIHPLNKQEVGRRLALQALRKTYGHDVVASGPTLHEVQIDGATVRVRFDDIGGGLVTSDTAAPRGFALAGADRIFRWATSATIDGDTVVLQADGLDHPVAVRYGWDINPDVNLVNAEGLPAATFRSDGWPMATGGRR